MLVCSFERLVGIDERIDGNACDKTPRLGAPGAVFRTTARFGIDDAAEVKDPICELDRRLFGGGHERLRAIRAQFQSLFPSRHAFQRSEGKVQAGVFSAIGSIVCFSSLNSLVWQSETNILQISCYHLFFS